MSRITWRDSLTFKSTYDILSKCNPRLGARKFYSTLTEVKLKISLGIIPEELDADKLAQLTGIPVEDAALIPRSRWEEFDAGWVVVWAGFRPLPRGRVIGT
jgi:hypothetical protein